MRRGLGMISYTVRRQILSNLEKAKSDGLADKLGELHESYWKSGGCDREDTALHMIRQGDFSTVLEVYRLLGTKDDEGLIRDSCLDYFSDYGYSVEDLERLLSIGAAKLRTLSYVSCVPLRLFKYKMVSLLSTFNWRGCVWEQCGGYSREGYYLMWSDWNSTELIVSTSVGLCKGGVIDETWLTFSLTSDGENLDLKFKSAKKVEITLEEQEGLRVWLAEVLTACSPREYTADEIFDMYKGEVGK